MRRRRLLLWKHIRNFYGDTIVFALDDIVKEKLAEYVELLYQSAPE